MRVRPELVRSERPTMNKLPKQQELTAVIARSSVGFLLLSLCSHSWSGALRLMTCWLRTGCEQLESHSAQSACPPRPRCWHVQRFVRLARRVPNSKRQYVLPVTACVLAPATVSPADGGNHEAVLLRSRFSSVARWHCANGAHAFEYFAASLLSRSGRLCSCG
jgi:hypothetical protein